MAIQTSGDDRRESDVDQTSRAQFESEMKKRFGNTITLRLCANGDGEYFAWGAQVAWHAWQASRATIESKPQTPLLLPPPITEADGYRLNTSWHSGAIFRDGANWMLEQAKQMQPTLVITLPDTGSKAFWHGSGKSEVFIPAAYKRWVKEAIERHCAMARVDVEVK